MTLLLLFEALEAGNVRLNDKIMISNYAAAQQPSKLGLSPGELDEKRQKLREALTFLQKVVIAIHELLPRVGFDVIPTEKVQTLKKMFSRGEKQLDEYVKYNKECVETLAEIKSRVTELIQVENIAKSRFFA